MLYTLGSDDCRIHCEPVNRVFRDWAKEKYPFVDVFFKSRSLNANRKKLREEIKSHCSSKGNVFCICNNRQMFCDADCYVRTNHVCLLPFVFGCAQTVVELLGVIKSARILTGKMTQLTACHHMFPSITS